MADAATDAPRDATPERRWRNAALAAALLIAPVAALIAARLEVRYSQGHARVRSRAIDVPESALNFGVVWSGSDFQWELPVTNTTAAAVTIERIDMSCNCTRAEPLPLTIAAGQTRKLMLNIDLRRARPPVAQGGEAVTPFSVTLRPIVTELPTRAAWQLRGAVQTAWVSSSPALDIGDVVVGATPSEMSAELTCLNGVVALAAECDPRFAEVKLNQKKSGPPTYRLSVWPKPGHTTGRSTGSIRIRAVGPNRQLIPDGTVAVMMNLVGPVAAVPDALHLGLVKPGVAIPQTVTLHSRTGTAFLVESVRSIDPSIVSVSLAQPAANNSSHLQQVVPISILPKAPGDRTTIVELTVRQEASEPFTVDIPVSFSNEAPGLARQTGSDDGA